MICYINGATTRRLSLSDPLLCAGLSARAYNTLVRADIQTIQDLLACDRKKLENIRGLGSKSINEILDFLEHLQSYPDCKKLYPLTGDAVSPPAVDRSVPPKQNWPEQIPEVLMEQSLEVLPLNTRASNCLRRFGCHTIGDLVQYCYKDILKIRGLGLRTANEIVDVLNEYIAQHTDPLLDGPEPSTPAAQACRRFFRALSRDIVVCDIVLYRELLEEFEAACREVRPVNYPALYRKDKLRQAVSAIISRILIPYHFGLERDLLAQSVPAELNLPGDVLDAVLTEMEQSNLIRFLGSKVCLCHMSIMDLARKIPDARFREMLLKRLKGFSLREIASQYDLSQERVRQIISDGLNKSRTRVEEDKYLPIFLSYRFTKDEFTQAFCEPAETYHYLSIVVGNVTRLPISQYKDDPTLPDELRQGVRNLLRQDCICINGEFVKRNQTSFTRFIVRTYFPDEVTFDTLMAKYNELLQNLGLDQDPKLVIHERSYINHLRAMEFLLWKPGCRCRYYDVDARDYDELLDTLSLEQYHNAEYSTRKFFLAEPELMRKYDIRDEYELHNLLRKVCTARNMKNIQFLRMPIVSFGTSDRTRQVYEVLLANSPISQRSFLEKYEELYGLDLNINPHHYLAPFAEYCREGIYDVRDMQAQRKEGSVLPSP